MFIVTKKFELFDGNPEFANFLMKFWDLRVFASSKQVAMAGGYRYLPVIALGLVLFNLFQYIGVVFATSDSGSFGQCHPYVKSELPRLALWGSTSY